MQCLNAVYGTIVAALLYYKKFVKRLTNRGYKINPFEQIMICFHVDDCKISHESSKVIDETIEWLREEYQSIFKDGSGAMKEHRGKVHKKLGMTLDFSHKGKCHVSMYDYVDGILEAFDDDIKKYDDCYLKVGKSRSKTNAAPEYLWAKCGMLNPLMMQLRLC